MARLFKSDLQLPVERIIKEKVPAMIETVIGNMVPVLVETAVLKGQIELLFDICNQAAKEIDKINAQHERNHSKRSQAWAEDFAHIIKVCDEVGHDLRKQLDYLATTECWDDDTPVFTTSRSGAFCDTSDRNDEFIEKMSGKKKLPDNISHLPSIYIDGELEDIVGYDIPIWLSGHITGKRQDVIVWDVEGKNSYPAEITYGHKSDIGVHTYIRLKEQT